MIFQCSSEFQEWKRSTFIMHSEFFITKSFDERTEQKETNGDRGKPNFFFIYYMRVFLKNSLIKNRFINNNNNNKREAVSIYGRFFLFFLEHERNEKKLTATGLTRSGLQSNQFIKVRTQKQISAQQSWDKVIG